MRWPSTSTGAEVCVAYESVIAVPLNVPAAWQLEGTLLSQPAASLLRLDSGFLDHFGVLHCLGADQVANCSGVLVTMSMSDAASFSLTWADVADHEAP
jgi:hypothetical protein